VGPKNDVFVNFHIFFYLVNFDHSTALFITAGLFVRNNFLFWAPKRSHRCQQSPIELAAFSKDNKKKTIKSDKFFQN